MDYSVETLAQIGFNAYGDKVGWLNYEGEVMPTWETLEEPTREAWVTAAEAIVRARGD
jgi:hypothetical protein